MCLIAQTNVKPCVAQKDIKVIKLLKKQENGSYVTPFQGVTVALNSTLCAGGSSNAFTCGYNNCRKEITAGFVHAKLRIEQNDKGNNIVGIVAYIPKGTEYFVNIYVSEVCAKELFITDEVVDLYTFALSSDEVTDVIKPFIEQLIPTNEVAPGWLFTAEKQFVHPLCYKDGTGIIGVVAATNVNGKPTAVFSLDEKELGWDDSVEYCKEYETNGTKAGDWTLPDKDVLQKAFEKHITEINLALTSIEGKMLSGWLYWTSAEYSFANAWICDAYDTYLAYNFKWFSNSVRPSFAVDV